MSETGRVIARGTSVIAFAEPVTGVVRYLKTPTDVLELLDEPDIENMVVLSRGGTATFLGALLQEGPAGIITVEGAPESHLGIIAREFGIPTIMSIELDDNPVEKFAAPGVVSDDYVAYVVKALDGLSVELDCSQASIGRVLTS